LVRYSDDLLTDMAFNAAIIFVLLLYPLWRIFSRAGIAPTASLLVLVSYAGPSMVLLLLAFQDWPNRGKDEATGKTDEAAP